jgi:hypothetical protein
MAEDNITSYTISFLLIGLVTMGMLSAFILLVNNEGRGEIFDPYPEIETFNQNLTGIYEGQLVDTVDVNTNLSSNYNPELSISSADRSGNAIGVGLQTLASATWTSLIVFGGLIFGSAWGLLSGILIAIATSLFTYYLIKNIRTGT